jgi:cytochrome b pre-mRNA-processing protein 6
MAQPGSNTLGLLAKHYTRILSLWPKDPLRPDVQFSSLLTSRQSGLRKLAEKQSNAEMRNVNALYSLLDDRYSKRVRF